MEIYSFLKLFLESEMEIHPFLKLFLESAFIIFCPETFSLISHGHSYSQKS